MIVLDLNGIVSSKKFYIYKQNSKKEQNLNIQTQCKAIFGRRVKLTIYLSYAASLPQTFCRDQRKIKQQVHGAIKLVSLKKP